MENFTLDNLKVGLIDEEEVTVGTPTSEKFEKSVEENLPQYLLNICEFLETFNEALHTERTDLEEQLRQHSLSMEIVRVVADILCRIIDNSNNSVGTPTGFSGTYKYDKYRLNIEIIFSATSIEYILKLV